MPAPKKPDPPLKFEFATNSLRNTTVAVDSDQYYYEVVTRFWHRNITKINQLDYETRELRTVAEIERVPRKEPRVRFRRPGADDRGKAVDDKESELGDWVTASEFMKYDPQRVGGTFVTGKGVEYRWKTHKRRLRLVRADDSEETPVVSYHPHRRHFGVWRMSRHAYLEVKPELTDSLEKLIASYLLVERRRRDTRLRVKFEYST